MKNSTAKMFALAIVAFFLVLFAGYSGYFFGKTFVTTPPETPQNPVWINEITGSVDTSLIDLRGVNVTGKVRAVCAERYQSTNLLIDRTGNVWGVDFPLDSKILYQLWIDDMATPDNVEDDEILTVWECR